MTLSVNRVKVHLSPDLRFPTMRITAIVSCFAACLVVASCAVGPDYARPAAGAPGQWQASLPHAGKPALLVDWWRQFDDPLVAVLIERSARDNPTLEQALARIRQSRAGLGVARSALFPSVDLAASRTRSGGEPAFEQTAARTTFDAAWEIDLFGGNRRASEAALARLSGARFAWHEARVSLAAEVALNYLGLRACEARFADAESDLASRRATRELTLRKVEAGFSAPADGALAQASAADTATRLLALRVDCEISIKALVALTGMAEPELRSELAARRGRLPLPAALVVDELPLRVLSARPDIAVAERALAAASAEIGLAEAARYPRLSLFGAIGQQRQTLAGLTANGAFWSFGPALDLPIFDAGRRAANADAARARYDEALAGYKAVVRRAVREVEEALVRLSTAAEREAQAALAAERYAAVFNAADQRWQVGLGSQIELEDTRRLAIAARSQHIGVHYDSIAAWIGLYRAVGGGWTADLEPAGLPGS